jgi:phosphatidylserine/phosphatidylglycerophosphate/cardiolipin synthase-like enzyme
LIGLVDSAHKTLAIYTERLEPSPLFDAVVQATQRGVLVRVLGAPISQKERSTIGFAELTRGGKFDIRTPPRPRVHAALMIVDGNNVFLGSENIDDSPAEQRRGLGIMFAEPSIAARLSTVFEQDWQSSPADPWRQVPR